MNQKLKETAAKLVGVVTSRNFLLMAGTALVSCASAHASAQGLPWEGPLDQVKSSITGPVAVGVTTLAIAGGSLGLIFGGELDAFAKRACYVVLGAGATLGAAQIASLFSVSSILIR
jgi:type IV secretion system protein TrbC